MKQLIINMLRTLFAFPIIIATTIVLYFAFDQSFISSIVYATLGVTAIYVISSRVMNYYFLKKHQLTRKEYVFIKRNLREAKGKIKRLHKALFSIHHLPSLKQRIHLVRLIRKIFTITKKEPRRFYQAEHFYYKHLDSVVELIEKFVFLSRQPNKSSELALSLQKTERTLEQLTDSIQKDLEEVIADDIDDLHFEIDVANYSDERRK